MSVESSSWSSQEGLGQEGGSFRCSLMKGAGILQLRATFDQTVLLRVLDIPLCSSDPEVIYLDQLLLLPCASLSHHCFLAHCMCSGTAACSGRTEHDHVRE